MRQFCGRNVKCSQQAAGRPSRIRSAAMRVLVVTNFEPDAAAPQRGRWVRDQIEEVRAARRRGRGLQLPARLAASTSRRPGGCGGCCAASAFDLVHAHYGLPGWCARLAGARPLVVTFHGTDVRHGVVGPLSRRLAWRADLVAAVSRALFAPEDGRPGLPPVPGLGRPALRARPRPLPPAAARRGAAGAGARPRRPLPALPRQPRAAREARRPRGRAGRGLRRRAADRRLDRARADAALGQRRQRGPRHLRLRGLRPRLRRGARLRRPRPLDPGRDRPVRARGDRGRPLRPVRRSTAWSAAARPHLDAPDPRVAGAARAASLSAARMAERTIEAYRDVSSASS